jgi:alkanesulfonate monooxygenase SsuD/methylene tetrahydromethanopterin reductase-like flavin-dependent oxidoreductase (luciferase family)
MTSATAESDLSGAGGFLGEFSVGLAIYTGQHASAMTGASYRDAVETAVVAEAAGFDALWLSEHHGWDDGYCPSPLSLAAAMAGATTRIRLATGVLLAPLYDPVRLATDAVVVDNLSEGRLILGLGLGYLQDEFDAFGVNFRTRGRALTETVEMLRSCWSGERFSYHGQVYQRSSIRVTPRSCRPDGIPIWLGGYAVPALERVRALADGYITARPTPELIDPANEALGSQGGPVRPGFTFACFATAGLTTPGGGIESALDGVAIQEQRYEQVAAGLNVYAGSDHYDGSRSGGGLSVDEIERYFQAYGDAQELIERLAAIVQPLLRWQNIHLGLRVIFPEQDRSILVRRIETFGKEVLPGLRERVAPAQRVRVGKSPV